MDELVAKKKSEITSLAGKFCEEYLNDEYQSLCEKVILKLSRKKQVPFLTGKVEIWASAVVWCIARVNFFLIRPINIILQVMIFAITLVQKKVQLAKRLL